jgi:hypothetical protein
MPPSLNSEDLVQPFTAAVAGLSWMSETDDPFEVLYWTGIPSEQLTPQEVLHRAKLPPDTPVEGMTLEAFLAPATQGQPWHTDEEAQSAKQFQALQTLLEQTLTQLQVYRCGTVEREIYVVGQAQNLDWIVLHTTAVET